MLAKGFQERARYHGASQCISVLSDCCGCIEKSRVRLAQDTERSFHLTG